MKTPAMILAAATVVAMSLGPATAPADASSRSGLRFDVRAAKVSVPLVSGVDPIGSGPKAFYGQPRMSTMRPQDLRIEVGVLDDGAALSGRTFRDVTLILMVDGQVLAQKYVPAMGGQASLPRQPILRGAMAAGANTSRHVACVLVRGTMIDDLPLAFSDQQCERMVF